MCGLAGWVSSDLAQFKKLEINITHTLDSLKFRGPDSLDYRVLEQYNVGLLHTRLSILDTRSISNQPFSSSNDDWILVFNGEVYNHTEIRQTYLRDTKFRTNSDTETLVELISKYGFEKAIALLDGMFAIAAFQFSTKLLYLARDYFGEKPLFYSNSQKNFIFGSTVESIKRISNEKFDFQLEELSSVVLHGFNISNSTVYHGIMAVEPGTILSFQFENILKKQAFKPNFRSENLSFEDLLIDSVSTRLNADVPVGCFLSGGFDSTLIAAIASKIASRKLSAFTFSTGDEFDEALTASMNAKLLGLDHHIINYDATKLLDVVNDLARVNDQPFCDSSQIPTYIVSHDASKHVKVMLGGDGADELFYGYNRYSFTNKIVSQKKFRPLMVLLSLMNNKCGEQFLHSIQGRVFSNFVRDPNFYRKLIKLYRYFSYKENDKDYLGYLCDFRAGLNILSEDYRSYLLGRSYKFNDLEDVRDYDFKVYLPGDILTKVDRATMRWGLEARSPFLNYSIFEYSNNKHVKLENIRKPKSNIRELLLRLEPKIKVPRSKQGFVAPAQKWIRNELYDWINDNLNSKKFSDLEIVNLATAKGMLRDHRLGKFDYTDVLWKVGMTSSWVNAR